MNPRPPSPDEATTEAVPQAVVIIPNHNGAHLLPGCLDSLAQQTFADFQTVVVDNASTDESRELIRQRYPQVELVELSENQVFAGAVNEGIRRTRSEIVVLLNNDTEAEPQWLAELVDALQRHPEAGMAASKMLLFDRRDVLNSTGDFYRRSGIPGNRGVWERDEGQYDQDLEVFGPCGGAAAYRRDMLDVVGLFDEDFVGYGEDVDLAFRAQLAGYRCVFAPRARVYHRLSATGGGPLASYLTGRNFVSIIVKDMPAHLVRRYWWRILGAQAGRALHSLRHFREPAARATLRGQLAALRQLPLMLTKRRRVQASRRVSLEYISSILSA